MSGDRRYAGIDVPHTESLKDTIARAVPYYEREIAPALAAGKRVLVAAHGNSLRGIIKYLSNISDDEIVGLEIPTGKPIVYELADDLSVLRRYYLDESLSRGLAAVHGLVGAIHDRFGGVERADHADSDRHAQWQRLAVVLEFAARSGRSGGLPFPGRILVAAFQQDPELIAADAGHHVAVADALGKQVRDLDQRFVARPVPERVVDHLEPVDVDEQHRRPDPVTVDSRNQPLQLAHEAAPIRKIDQRIQMRQLVELLNALLQPGHLAPQRTDLFDQPVTIIDVDDVGQLIRHLPRALALSNT